MIFCQHQVTRGMFNVKYGAWRCEFTTRTAMTYNSSGVMQSKNKQTPWVGNAREDDARKFKLCEKGKPKSLVCLLHAILHKTAVATATSHPPPSTPLRRVFCSASYTLGSANMALQSVTLGLGAPDQVVPAVHFLKSAPRYLYHMADQSEPSDRWIDHSPVLTDLFIYICSSKDSREGV